MQQQQQFGEGEEPIMNAGIGRKGTGKTHQTLIEAADYTQGDPSVGAAPRRVLWCDLNNELGNIPQVFKLNMNVQSIALQDVPQWCEKVPIEIRRLLPFNLDGSIMGLDEMQAMIMEALQKFYGGLLVIEDPSKVLSNSLPLDFVSRVCTNR